MKKLITMSVVAHRDIWKCRKVAGKIKILYKAIRPSNKRLETR